MDSLAVDWDVIEVLSKFHPDVKGKGNATQQVTRDGLGRVQGQQGEKQTPRVAKYPVHGGDLLGVECELY